MIRRAADPLEDIEVLASDPALLEACLAVHRRLDLDGQLETLMRSVVSWCDDSCGAALGPSEDGQSWSLVSSTLPKRDERRAIIGRLDMELLRRSLSPKRVEVHEGLGPLESAADGWAEERPGWTTAIALTAPGTSLPQGLALVMHRHEPSSAWRERVSQLVDSIAPALSNAAQVATMRDLVIKDDTAHCFNRRYFESCLPDELARAGRFHAPLSLIFLDMDNLKQVNQRHGHARGSRTLFEVSQRISQKIRRFDKLFRYGGDEFCIVLPETEWHGAVEVAERVRESILRSPFLLDELKDGTGAPMSASLGIASYPLHARTQAELIEQADRAMQRIKNGTKNSVGVAECDGGDDER